MDLNMPILEISHLLQLRMQLLALADAIVPGIVPVQRHFGPHATQNLLSPCFRPKGQDHSVHHSTAEQLGAKALLHALLPLGGLEHGAAILRFKLRYRYRLARVKRKSISFARQTGANM